MKWLCPLSLPLTCVFSDTGTLIDLIPGATKETFLYTTEAISDMKITNYHYPESWYVRVSKVVIQVIVIENIMNVWRGKNIVD